MDEYALWLVQNTLHLFNMKLEFVTKCAQWRVLEKNHQYHNCGQLVREPGCNRCCTLIDVHHRGLLHLNIGGRM